MSSFGQRLPYSGSSCVHEVAIEPPPEIPKEAQEPSHVLTPAGQKASLKLSTANDANPQFVSAIVAPLHVYAGETQTLTVKVRSEDPITSVVATTELDNETFDIVTNGTAQL